MHFQYDSVIVLITFVLNSFMWNRFTSKSMNCRIMFVEWSQSNAASSMLMKRLELVWCVAYFACSVLHLVGGLLFVLGLAWRLCSADANADFLPVWTQPHTDQCVQHTLRQLVSQVSTPRSRRYDRHNSPTLKLFYFDVFSQCFDFWRGACDLHFVIIC